VWPEGSTSEHVRRLQSVTDAALAHLRLDELLGALLERTREILEVDTCAILLLDEATNELVARAALGIEEEVEQGVRVPVGGGFAGRIAAEKRPVILDDVDHAHVLNPILREKGIKSMLGVPLVVEAEVRGVLHVGSLRPRAFHSDEVELLQLVADRAALAIEHARLFEAERAARERIENVQAVTDAALAHLEVNELLNVLLPRIRDILRADTCAVLLYDDETNELVARAALGIEEEVEQGVRIPVGGGFAGQIAADKRPVILDDVDHSNVLNPILREKGIKSMFGVPLVVEGEVLGVLHVGSLVPRQFRDDEVELLQLVADRAALAIEHARVFEAERAARERIEHVQAVTDAALAHLEVDELLHVLLPRIRSILRTDTCAGPVAPFPQHPSGFPVVGSAGRRFGPRRGDTAAPAALPSGPTSRPAAVVRGCRSGRRSPVAVLASSRELVAARVQPERQLRTSFRTLFASPGKRDLAMRRGPCGVTT
jgi:GAF domain-containing protein